MAYQVLRKCETDHTSYPWDRVFMLPLDPADGAFRVFYSDPFDLDDVRDLVYEAFEMPLWGNA
jgi:hypothetical protein